MDSIGLINDFDMFNKDTLSFLNNIPLDRTLIGIYASIVNITFMHTSFHGEIRHSDIPFEKTFDFISYENKRHAIQLFFQYLDLHGMVDSKFYASSEKNTKITTCILNPNAHWITVNAVNVYSVVDQSFYEQRLDLEVRTKDQFDQTHIQKLHLFRHETTDIAGDIFDRLSKKIEKNIIVPRSIFDEYESIQHIEQL
jgi:hypothetical protein